MRRASVRLATAIAVVIVLSAGFLAGAEGEAASAIRPEEVVGAPEGKPLAGAELDRRTEELASIMRCPVCQALSVADSPTASALAMREEARDLLAAGYSEEQVLEYFETSYGEFILLAPKKRGLNLLVWLAPLAFLLLGAGLVARRVGRRGSAQEAPTEGGSELESYVERVRREVGQ